MQPVFQHVVFISFFLLALALPKVANSDDAGIDYVKVLCDIKTDLANLAEKFPQLKEFEEEAELDESRLSLSYAFHTHSPERRGGWTSGVPNPDPDGIWFYIDFHDPESTRQIHTQPVVIPLCIGSKMVSFLILEGDKTHSLRVKVMGVLRKHGVKDCSEAG